MSTGERMPLDIASSAAAYLMSTWGMAPPECQVVGSVRRGRPDVGDLEMIAPMPAEGAADPLFEAVHASLHHVENLFGVVGEGTRMTGRVVKGLKRGFKCCELEVTIYRARTGEPRQIPVQIHRYTAANRGWIELMRTGPRELGILFLERWKKRWAIPHGQEASREGHLVDAGGRVIEVESEARAFEFAGMPFVPPGQREAWTESILQARRLSGARA